MDCKIDGGRTSSNNLLSLAVDFAPESEERPAEKSVQGERQEQAQDECNDAAHSCFLILAVECSLMMAVGRSVVGGRRGAVSIVSV